MVLSHSRFLLPANSSSGSLRSLLELTGELASASSCQSRFLQSRVDERLWANYVQSQFSMLKSWSRRFVELKQKGRNSFRREAPQAVLAEVLVVTQFNRFWNAALLFEQECNRSVSERMPELIYLQTRMNQFENEMLTFLKTEVRNGREALILEEAYQYYSSWTSHALAKLKENLTLESQTSELGKMLWGPLGRQTVSIPVTLPPDEELFRILDCLDTRRRPAAILISELLDSVHELLMLESRPEAV